MKIEIKQNIKFDDSQLQKDLIKDIQDKSGILSDLRSMHRDGYEAGKDTEGRKQRTYAKSYQAAIKAGKIPGKAPETYNKPTLRIKGALLSSVQIVNEKKGAALKFLGQHYSGQSNEQLASKLKKKGFRFHSLSKKDNAYIMKRIKQILKERLRGIVTKK